MASKKHWKIEASTDGVVSQLLISPGEAVVEGDSLLVLEAMKLLFYETSPGAGFFYPLVPLSTFVHQGQLIGKVFLEKQPLAEETK